MGIAASLASGFTANFATMTKPLHAGNAARNGVLAATLGKAGYTANPAAFEGRNGYFQSFARGINVSYDGFKDLGSLNVRSTFLHMIADALGTVAVIASGIAIMIWGPSASWVDPAVTALIAVYVLVHGSTEIRESIAVLMDSAPKGFDHDGLLRHLRRAR